MTLLDLAKKIKNQLITTSYNSSALKGYEKISDTEIHILREGIKQQTKGEHRETFSFAIHTCNWVYSY